MQGASRAFELLAADYRRQILVLLCDSESVAVPEAVVTRSAGSGSQGATAASGLDSTAAIELHHSHLPKLAEAGVVEWDRDAGVVRRGPSFEAIEPLVRLLLANPDRVPGELL